MSVIDSPPVVWPLPTDFEPRPYQLEAVRRILDGNLVLDVALGGGKSSISCAAAEALGAVRVLVLCPAKVIPVWRDEVNENAARTWTVWSGEVPGRGGKALANPSVARRVEAIINADAGARRIGRPFMVVANYESTRQRRMRELLLGTPWDMLVVDESHKISAAGGKDSKFIAKIGERVRGRGGRVVLATGTFMPHSALSVFGQLRTLDPSILGPYWTHFKARYASWKVLRERRWCEGCMTFSSQGVGEMCLRCGHPVQAGEPVYMTTPGGQPIPDGVRPDREDELLARIAPHVLRVSQAELDAQTGLVETLPQIRACTLRPATRKVYDAVQSDLIAHVGDGTITAANAMVAVLRLAQVTSGYGVDANDPTGDRHISLAPEGEQPEKIKLLADELSDYEQREPVVIFARFRRDLAEIADLCARQGRRYGEISGRRTDGLDGHRMHPDIDVVGVQPQSGGAGISLTRAAVCIFYSSTWSLAEYDQAKRRVLRQGQTRHVTYLHLVATDTIDETLFYALRKRRATNLAILDRLGGRS